MVENVPEFSEKSFHFTNETDIVILSCSSSDSSLCSDTDVHVCRTECLNVIISEVLNPSYGLYVWPSAPVLAQYIWKNKLYICGKHVLELGAGTALPSIVAAKCGAHVIASDGENFTQTINCSKKNMELNKISAKSYVISKISWGTFCPSVLAVKSVDILLGSDVFYDVDDFEDIIVTVSYLLRKNDGAEFWCTYQERNCGWNIQHLLEKWCLEGEEIPLETFGASDSAFSSWNIPSDQKISLFIFRICNEK